MLKKNWKQLYILLIQTVFTEKWFWIFTYYPGATSKKIKTDELGKDSNSTVDPCDIKNQNQQNMSKIKVNLLFLYSPMKKKS
jgi:hypothetical protein